MRAWRVLRRPTPRTPHTGLIPVVVAVVAAGILLILATLFSLVRGKEMRHVASATEV